MTSNPADVIDPPVTAADQTVRQLLQPLQAWLDQPDITELAINQPQQVWLRQVNQWQQVDAPELSLSYLQALITALQVYNGLNLSATAVIILPGGERGQIVQPPACLQGTLALSIRKHCPTVKSLAEYATDGALQGVQDVSYQQPDLETIAALVQQGDHRVGPIEQELLSLKAQGDIQTFLQQAVRHRRNIIIAGKTGSGKTTWARALIAEVPLDERLITIEDVHELILDHHPNRIHLLYGEGQGRISAEDCLSCCLRLAPERILLAELRGGEAWSYLSALNTGHPGSVTTVHANSARASFERISTLIHKSSLSRQVPLEALQQVLRTTLDVVLFCQDWRLTELFYDPLWAHQHQLS